MILYETDLYALSAPAGSKLGLWNDWPLIAAISASLS